MPEGLALSIKSRVDSKMLTRIADGILRQPGMGQYASWLPEFVWIRYPLRRREKRNKFVKTLVCQPKPRRRDVRTHQVDVRTSPGWRMLDESAVPLRGEWRATQV